MGCFSFICQKTKEPILSSSFKGDAVHLFLLKDGIVIEHMFGNYDSYGRVFSNVKDSNDKSLTEFSSYEWNLPWGDVCNLMFSSNKGNGIAAILGPYWKEGDPYPTERSKDDPEQGWGEHESWSPEFSEVLQTTVEKPFHKIIPAEDEKDI